LRNATKLGMICVLIRYASTSEHSLAISTIPTDYIEYMMGHMISTYNDVKMKGGT